MKLIIIIIIIIIMIIIIKNKVSHKSSIQQEMLVEKCSAKNAPVE